LGGGEAGEGVEAAGEVGGACKEDFDFTALLLYDEAVIVPAHCGDAGIGLLLEHVFETGQRLDHAATPAQAAFVGGG